MNIGIHAVQARKSGASQSDALRVSEQIRDAFGPGAGSFTYSVLKCDVTKSASQDTFTFAAEVLLPLSNPHAAINSAGQDINAFVKSSGWTIV
ncbi:hypothetical protein [uncultured Thiodictyon sp.]|jgi:hypothetical protein|uniref:hypothetical protein n=1 Tax=uncultured Thiodictyon sp. TaxID=1846217 RepID=UPI0025EDA917|nr:hypothetical protein [uncultured Thiodictyon sp.]